MQRRNARDMSKFSALKETHYFQKYNIILAVIHFVVSATVIYYISGTDRTKTYECGWELPKNATEPFYSAAAYVCNQTSSFYISGILITETIWTTTAHTLYSIFPELFYTAITKFSLINFWIEYSVSATLIFICVQTFLALVDVSLYPHFAMLLASMMLFPLFTRSDTKIARISSAISQTLFYLGVMYPLVHRLAYASLYSEIPDIAVAMTVVLLIMYTSFPIAFIYVNVNNLPNTFLAKVLMFLSLSSKVMLRSIIAVALAM